MSLLLAVFFIHACGFQLRGALDLSQDISPVYIQQNSAFKLAREIKSILTTNKIAVEKSESKANTQLVLLNEAKSSRVLSVDANGRAREYLLTYNVNFSIKIKQAEETKDSIMLSRSLLFDPDAVLAVTNQTGVLYKDMQRDAARLILLKLQARAKTVAGKHDVSKQGSASGQKEVLDPQ